MQTALTPLKTVILALLMPTVVICQSTHHSDTNYLDVIQKVNPEHIGAHLTTLASDTFEGRETGEPGNDKAAQYIAQKIKEAGLTAIDEDGDYLQPFIVSKRSWQDLEIAAGASSYRHLRDFIAPHYSNGSVDDLTNDQLYFVSYGIETEQLSNYAQSDLSGQVVLMYRGEPRDKKGNYLLTGTDEPSEWSNDFMKIKLAIDKGAKAVLLIDPNFNKTLEQNRRFLVGPMISSQTSMGDLPDHIYAMVRPSLAKDLLGRRTKKATKMRSKNARGKSTKPLKVKRAVKIDVVPSIDQLQTQNVAGLIPGADPSLQEETIIVTAHYDHLGRRGDDVFNGADDNGSGTSTLLAMAEAIQHGISRGLTIRRPVLFLWVSGEEKGLLGSEYYVNHPLLPLEHHMTNVNVDMIGRTDDKHDDGHYIYVIGADRLSTTLHEVNEQINQRYVKLDLDYTYNAEDDPNRYYYRSDHYNFAKHQIPAVFFFSGVHRDYHRPSDTAEKIDLVKTSRIGQHILHLIYELAMREAPIEVNVK